MRGTKRVCRKNGIKEQVYFGAKKDLESMHNFFLMHISHEFFEEPVISCNLNLLSWRTPQSECDPSVGQEKKRNSKGLSDTPIILQLILGRASI